MSTDLTSGLGDKNSFREVRHPLRKCRRGEGMSFCALGWERLKVASEVRFPRWQQGVQSSAGGKVVAESSMSGGAGARN